MAVTLRDVAHLLLIDDRVNDAAGEKTESKNHEESCSKLAVFNCDVGLHKLSGGRGTERQNCSQCRPSPACSNNGAAPVKKFRRDNLDVPPGLFLRDVFRAVRHNVSGRADGFDAIAAVAVFPAFPNRGPMNTLTIGPESVNVMPRAGRVLLESVKVRDAGKFFSHESLVRLLRRPNRRFPSERVMCNHLPRCEFIDPTRHQKLLFRVGSRFVHVSVLGRPSD